MSYNLENMFDPYDDPNKLDDDWTEDGKEHWTLEKMNVKLQNLAKVVKSVKNEAGTSCPDILIVTEIENLWVAKQWKDGPLKDCAYERIIIDRKSTDPRGIQSAIFSRLSLASPVRSIPVYNNGRTILEATFQKEGRPLTVFANHWKSRVNRDGETDNGAGKRSQAAQILRTRILEILADTPNADIIAGGDFNDEAEDASMRVLGVAQNASTQTHSPLLFEPSYELKNAKVLEELEEPSQKDFMFRYLRGTYFYSKNFYQLDHLYISRGLLDSEGFTYTRNSFQVVRLKEFTHPRTRGPLSFRWSDDENERGPLGASDHFPILIRLNVSGEN